MRIFLSLFILLTFTLTAKSQNLSYTCSIDTVLGCGNNCISALSVVIPDIRAQASDYVVTQSTPQVSSCYPQVPPGAPGPSTSLTIDDRYSTVITLPFTFNFYGVPYNSLIASTNGYVSFDVSLTTAFSHYQDRGNLPNVQYDRALIMGPYHDLNPAYITSPTQQIKYNVSGTAPNRKWILSFYKVPLFDCASLIENTHQIVLNETTNIIEVIIVDKQLCTTWQGARSMVGIQDFTRSKGLMAPGRFMTDPPWGSIGMNETWRFIPSQGPSLYRSLQLLDASGTVVATGDTTRLSPATFGWTFNNVCAPGTTPTFFVVKTTYQDPINPANFLISQDTVYVSPSRLPVTATSMNASCGNNNGTLTATPSTGVAPYTFQINGGPSQTTATFTGLAPGTYLVRATDVNGCFGEVTVVITVTASLTATFTKTNASCPGVANGSITVTPTTGTAPYTYSLNGGPAQASNTFSNLNPGTYTITINDNAGCSGSITTIITPGSNISGSSTSTPTACAGASNGSITATGSGGVGPYTYALDGGAPQASGTFNNVPSGSHTILITDSRGCTVTITRTVTSGSGVSLTSTVFNSACATSNNGSIVVTPSNGTAPFTYQLGANPAQASNTFTGLAPGTYTITVRDANGCIGTVTRTVSGGAGLSITQTSTATSCTTASDGSITITVNNGTAPFSYVLDGGIAQTSNVFTNVAAGSHTVAVTDNVGCTGSVTLTVGAGTSGSGTAATTATTCPGVNDGTITITPGGGAGPFTYTLNPGNITQSSATFTGLAAGTYNATYTNASGCASSNIGPITIAAGPALAGSFTRTNTSCNGASDGSITITPNPAGNYTYVLNPGNVSQVNNNVYTNLAAGTYAVTFTNATGCTGTISNMVIAPGPTLTGTATSTATNCPGVNDGTITISAPGTGSFTYTLNPGNITQTSAIFTGVAAGNYTATFTTASGCTSSNIGPITVAAGPALTGTATATATSCPTVNDGTVTVDPQGTGPFTFTLNPGNVSQASPTFTGLAPGTYTISFVTASGCMGTVTNNPVVTAGPFLTSTTTTTNPLCANINDGMVTINPTSGVGPYSFVLVPSTTPQTSPTFSNLAPGNYTYSFTDANGCTGTGSFILTTNPPIFVPATKTNALCNGNSDGTVTFTPTGGVGPYTYLLQPGTTYQTSSTITGLAAGTYTFTIKDNVGCTKDTSISITEPTLLTASASNTIAATCNGNDGTVQVTGNAGTSPYTYSLDGTTFQASNTFIAPNIGTFNNVKVKDANGCIATTSVTVQLLDTMRLTLGNDTTVCIGSSITLQPQTNDATTGFVWTATPSAAFSTLSNTNVKNPVATPKDTTTYRLNATWGVCTRQDDVIVNVLAKPIPNAGPDVIICPNDSTTLIGTATNLSGPISFAWSPAINLDRIDSSVVVAKPPAGSSTLYTLTVSDNYGCNFKPTDDVRVTVRPKVEAFAGNDTIAVTGQRHQLFGSGGAQYNWTPTAPLANANVQNPVATLSKDTRFTLVVRDVIGCLGYDTVFIKVYNGPTYYTPNAFTPNNDGRNDVFRAVPAGIVKTEYFRVFNRYGQLVFETNKWLKGWDGTFQGKPQAGGAYVWILKGTDKDGKTIEQKGTVLLIR